MFIKRLDFGRTCCTNLLNFEQSLQLAIGSDVVFGFARGVSSTARASSCASAVSKVAVQQNSGCKRTLFAEFQTLLHQNLLRHLWLGSFSVKTLFVRFD